MKLLQSAAGEMIAAAVMTAVLGLGCWLSYHAGVRESTEACSVASAEAETKALARAAQLEHAQIAEQAKVAAAVQAQKTVTGAALTRVQGQIVSLPTRPHSCDIGPETITALNGLRGQP